MKKNEYYMLQNENYNIYFEDSFKKLKLYLPKNLSSNINICIITDTNVGSLYLKNLCENLPYFNIFIYKINPGENSKNIYTYIDINRYLISNAFSRKDLLIALGGGVVGDITGFVSATYMRGIDYIQIPTTLLAQVDSSIGGKTAINLDSYKNVVGAFKLPILVYQNISTLKTLRKKELMSGYAEIIKHSLIADINYFNDLKNYDFTNFDIENIKEIIYKSCAIKKTYVDSDFYDNSNRMILNFGHTFGHAIEKEYNKLLSHGECITIGMMCAIYISYTRNLISYYEFDTIRKVLSKLYYNKHKIDNFNIKNIISNINYDKKNFNKNLNFILLNKIGNAFICDDITEKELLDAAKFALK